MGTIADEGVLGLSNGGVTYERIYEHLKKILPDVEDKKLQKMLA